MRGVLVLLVTALAAVGTGTATAGNAPASAGYESGAHAPSLVLRAGQSPSGFTGGPVTAADGETVAVYVQDELLAADPGAPQRWADALTGLLHGPELASVSLVLASADRIGQICGTGALGCYARDVIVALGEDVPGFRAQTVVSHEYGHHVAAHRLNDPWSAQDWGTKRWATYENVCARSQAGELFPGDEGRLYTLNPGELFAESYRLLNERRAGLPESTWRVVAPTLYPDQTAVDLVAEDVTSPWSGNTVATFSSRLAAGATGRGFRIATPLDGTLTATLTGPAKARFALRIVDLASGRVLADASTATRVKAATASICGQRTLQVQVRRLSGAGSFALTVSKP